MSNFVLFVNEGSVGDNKREVAWILGCKHSGREILRGVHRYCVKNSFDDAVYQKQYIENELQGIMTLYKPLVVSHEEQGVSDFKDYLAGAVEEDFVYTLNMVKRIAKQRNLPKIPSLISFIPKVKSPWPLDKEKVITKTACIKAIYYDAEGLMPQAPPLVSTVPKSESGSTSNPSSTSTWPKQTQPRSSESWSTSTSYSSWSNKDYVRTTSPLKKKEVEDKKTLWRELLEFIFTIIGVLIIIYFFCCIGIVLYIFIGEIIKLYNELMDYVYN